MLGGLRDKLIGRKRHDVDYGDVRSHVVGERPFSEPPTVADRFGIGKQEFPRDPYSAEPYAPAPFPAQPFPAQQPAFGSRPEPRDFAETRDFGPEQPQRNYDILDRLNLIESQLAAIRSQTETINERLKNMEARLAGRRY